MALIVEDRVKGTCSAPSGSAAFASLSGVTGFVSFDSVMGEGDTCFYVATDGSGNWETGYATWDDTAKTLARTTVHASSNSGSHVSFSGTVTVWVDATARHLRGVPVLLSEQSAASSASIVFALPDGFAHFELRITDLVPATDNVSLRATVSTDGGSVFESTNYKWVFHYAVSDNSVGIVRNDAAVSITLFDVIGNAAGEVANFIGHIFGAKNTAGYVTFGGSGTWVNYAAKAQTIRMSGLWGGVSAITHVKLDLSSGNIASGKFKLLGCL